MIYFLMLFSVVFALVLYMKTVKTYDGMLATLEKDNAEWKSFFEKVDKKLKESDFKTSRALSYNFTHLVMADTEEDYKSIVGDSENSDILWAKNEKATKGINYNGTFKLFIHGNILATIEHYKRNKKNKKKASLSKFHQEAQRLLDEEGNYHFSKRKFMNADTAS